MGYEPRAVSVTAFCLMLMCVLLFYMTIYKKEKTGINHPKELYMKKSVEVVSSEPCTFALFREASRRQGYFPIGGEWLKTGGVEHFQPTTCKYRYPRVKDPFMKKCLAKANISYVVTIGDSTGSRYAKALRVTSKLKCRGLLSEKLKQSGFLPDKKYFTRQIPKDVARFVTEKFRFCSGCSSNLNRCDFSYDNQSYSIELEHLAQTMILDDSLQLTFPSYKHAYGIVRQVWAITTQELLFRYYFKDKHPDVFLIFLPFSHAKQNIHMSRVLMEVEYFKKLVEVYLPPTTKLIYFTSYGEFEEARRNSKWHGVLFDGMLARDKIDKMNHVLYKVIKDDVLQTGGRYFGFLDLIDVSKDRGNWSTDGVHMKAVWYDSIMSMFWETYCNSVLLNKF